MKKKLTALMLSVVLTVSLAACSGEQQAEHADEALENLQQASEESDQADGNGAGSQTEEQETPQESSESEPGTEPPALSEEEPGGGSNILIAYFTYGENAELPSDVDASTTASIQLLNGEVTGNTGLMAHMVAEASGGDLFSIKTVEPYPDNYEDTIAAGEAEKNNGTYPELSTHIENLEQYDTVFVGFPNWWYGMPMVMYSFFEEYDFGGKTIIPFCTSGGSAFSDAIDEIKNAEPDAEVLDGLHIGGSSISGAQDRVEEWVDGLGLSE